MSSSQIKSSRQRMKNRNPYRNRNKGWHPRSMIRKNRYGDKLLMLSLLKAYKKILTA